MPVAISPTVQAYQQQQMSQSQQGLSSEEVSFHSKFGDLAFSALNAKFPVLQRHVVTFKVIESDLEKSFALGAFILEYAEDVVYIPVVLADGIVVSCEMIYNKTAETLVPLSNRAVQDVIAVNQASNATIAPANPSVDSTKKLFKDMFRPPSSSNPVLASSATFDELPDAAKEALTTTFTKNIDLLEKVAGFYPVQALAEKLARKISTADLPKTAANAPVVLRLDELTKEAAAKLSVEEKATLVKRGFILNPPPDNDTSVVSAKNLGSKLVTVLDLIELDMYQKGQASYHGTGQLVTLTDRGSIELEPCLIAGTQVLTKRGSLMRSDKTLIANFKDGLSAEDARAFGAVDPMTYKVPDDDERREPIDTIVFYPVRNGNYKGKNLHRMYGNLQKRVVDETVTLVNSPEYCSETSVSFSPYLKNGYILPTQGSTTFPSTSLILHVGRDKRLFMQSISGLNSIIRRTQPCLRITSDGPDFKLHDSSQTKTASRSKTFSDEGKLAEYLITHYKLTKEAAYRVLKDREAVVLTKTAFVQQPNQEYAGYTQQPVSSLNTTGYEPPMSQGQPASWIQNQGLGQGNYQVNEEMLDAAANLGDEEHFDTGMLASLAGNEDIKLLLVDMLPNFTTATTDLGKSILLFTVNKEEIEGYYGAEEYNGLLVNLRKMFRMLGELIFDLRKYVNMH